MTRLANIEKAGYFPVPASVTHLILSHVAAPHGGRILDPCAGEGTALVTMAQNLHLEPYGVELHESRAQAAREAVHELLAGRDGTQRDEIPHVLSDSYQSLITSRDGYNLLYLNPPYDRDDEDGRLEYQWLWRCRPWLQPGGLLVWVVPQHLLKFRKAARYVLSHFDHVRVYRFPDEEYEQFRQIVLCGVRRKRATTPEVEAVEAFRTMADDKEALPALAAAEEPVYTLPPLVVRAGEFKFRSLFVDPAEALAEAEQYGARTTDAWRRHLDPRAAEAPLRPLTPLKIGHMNSVIAAGHLNNQVLEEGDERLLIKGRSYKSTREESYEEPLPDGGTKVTSLETEVVVTDITTVDAQGDDQSYSGPALEQFLTRWIGKLTAIVARDYEPAYRFDMNGYGPLLARLSKERPIPGMNGRTGLLPAQKHAAAAVLTRLQAERDALTVGECGSGKAQPLTCKVLTPAGWKCMGDIQVDDEVINPEGGTARIVGVYPQGIKQIFRVTFSDGAQTECCDQHLWRVMTPERKWRDQHSQLMQLGDIRDKLFSQSGNARYFVPLVKPAEFEEQQLLLDPYLLGLLLGDGGLTQATITLATADQEILDAVQEALPEGLRLKSKKRYYYWIGGKSVGGGVSSSSGNALSSTVRELGLLGCKSSQKFIPRDYLFASADSRIALLQGLLDTDGSIPNGDSASPIEYCTTSQQLAQDVVELTRSLGGTAKVSTKRPSYRYKGRRLKGQLAYRVFVKLPNEIPPFRLSRKLDRVVPRTKYGINRAMVKVEYVGEKEAQCIALDSENGLYVTDDYIVTHNTTIGVAVAAGREADRTIVLCPPHLVDKWRREIKAVWPCAATMHLKTPGDVDRFFAARKDGRPVVGVLKQTTARSASGWEHAYDYGGPAGHNYGAGGFSDIRRPWGNVVSAAKLMEAEEGWRLSERQTAFLQMQGVRCPVCGGQQFANGRPLAAQELKSARRFCDNPKCGSPLFQFTRRRSESQERGSFRLYAQRERLLRGFLAQRGEVPERELNRWRGTAVRDTFGYARVPLAGYIKRRARERLDLVIVDEVHQYKGIDSDQGYAMHHLAQAAEKVVGLTGTVYGGKASSIFHLLYRLSPEMTGAYTDSQATGRRRIRHRDWVSAYGILQRIETKKLDEDGRQTANSRSNVRYKELPGGSPAMLPWLLNRSVFLSLGDMGFPLPEYSEIPVEVPMAPEQALLYESLKADLKAELVERLVRGDKSLLAGYLHALLFWPDSPRRAKVVRCPRTGRVVASVPGLPEAFRGPKEEAIVDLILEEKAQGRRVLLLCLQTDTLDIQPEWKQLLAEAGIKAAILRAAPNKREGWVEKQVTAGVDVIITHPKKVETGIDLLDFPTIVWMSPHYSVYTVLQASRRSWRIGQTRPVKVYYFAYEDTIQTDALYLVAAKVAAALRVNGDTVADDSLAELDEITGNDIVATLARIVTGETQLEAGLTAKNLQQAFAEANASIRQANTVVGEYGLLDDAAEPAGEEDAPAEVVAMPEPAPQHASQQTLVIGAGGRQFHGGTDGTADAGELNQTLLWPQPGVSQTPQPEGRTNGAPPTYSPHSAEEKDRDDKTKAPPVPRPRMLLDQLRSR